MTAINKGSFVPAGRKSGLGVHSLDHFVLQVPDMKVAWDFYTAFGLNLIEDGNSIQVRTFGNDHNWGTIVEGAEKKMHHLSFGAYAEDIPKFKENIEASSIKLLDPPMGMESNGLWFIGHDSVLTEIKAAPKTSLDEKQHAIITSVPENERGTGLGRGQSGKVRPHRLAHCLIFTSDVPGAISFYKDVLGLRLSDQSGGIVAFMHGMHGSDHHLLAFATSNGPGFHHCSWDVGQIDEIGRGALYMVNKGFVKGWGLGRHVIGSNYFHYIQDPWGGFCEYSCDVDYIPQGSVWDSRDFEVKDALYLWGPEVPDDFVHNYETN